MASIFCQHFYNNLLFSFYFYENKDLRISVNTFKYNQSDKIILGHIPPPYQEQNY